MMIRLAKKIRNIIRLVNHKKRSQKAYSQYLKMPERVDDTRKSVVIVVHSADYGGAPLVGLNMASEYVKAGYNVSIMSLRYGPLIPQMAEIAPTQVCLFHSEIEKYIQILHDIEFSIAICNGACTGSCVPIFKENGFEVISLIHELPDAVRSLMVEKDVAYMAKYSNRLIFPATFVRNEIDEQICAINCPVGVKHQGLYAIPYLAYDKQKAKSELADEFGFDESKPLYINVATINERKGFDLFARMAMIDDQANYLWVGDGIERRFGKQVVGSLGGVPKNLMLPGYISDKQTMEKIYSAADALALTSREEPFGSIVLEAFANRTPVVAFNNCGGYIDIVISGETGELVEPFELNKMISILHRLNEDKDKYVIMQENCYSVALCSNFSDYCSYVLSSIE